MSLTCFINIVGGAAFVLRNAQLTKEIADGNNAAIDQADSGHMHSKAIMCWLLVLLPLSTFPLCLTLISLFSFINLPFPSHAYGFGLFLF